MKIRKFKRDTFDHKDNKGYPVFQYMADSDQDIMDSGEGTGHKTRNHIPHAAKTGMSKLFKQRAEWMLVLVPTNQAHTV